MSLSNDLISEFVKATKDDKQVKDETTLYGTIRLNNGKPYVQFDGSDVLTPVELTKNGENEDITCGAYATENDRVLVRIKHHTATVIGNLSSPSAKSDDVADQGARMDEFDILVAYKVSTEELAAVDAVIDSLKTKVAQFNQMSSVVAEIEELRAYYAELDTITANDITALNAKIESIQASFGNFTGISTEALEAMNADINNLKSYNADFTYVSADVLSALNASIKKLDAEKASIAELDATYANIDFTNITKAAIEYFYSTSGLIKNVTVGNQTITGELVGVTIKGDLIEAGTLVADKLVFKGEDGLYYKLNTDSVTTEAEQTDYNSLNGQIIKAKSITATKVDVSDLVAFDATIGGFHITENSLYSGVKASIDNSTRGAYLDSLGQFALGDEDNFIRYYQDEDGVWKLEISAESILFGSDRKSSADDIKNLTNHVKVGTYTDPDTSEVTPCVELSEGDSDFKQVITNTSTLFMDGSNVRTKIDSDGVETGNVKVNGDFQQGGFVWSVRANGNLGLIWKGGV